MVFSILTAPAGAAPRDGADLQAAEAVVASENPFKGVEAGIFIVSLNDPAIALYKGGVAGLPATSTRGEAKLDVTAAAAVEYRTHLENQHAKLIDRLNRGLGRTVDVKAQYYNAANAIAVHLSPEEAARVLRMPGVKNVTPDRNHQIDTDYGPGWIGAPSIWDGSATGVGTQGEGIIVGVLDTGINPENPSFADVGGDGYDHTNPFGAGNYVGVCNPAEAVYQPDFACNDKLIGAWNLTADPGPIDDDGHGSHTASTAAGNVVEATVAAPTKSITPMISGVAPHANIIAYDVCIPSTCPGFAILAGIEQAIADGVDVINYSIGSPTATNPWDQEDELAFLAAREAGIFVAHSAGNEGPDAATSGSPNSPWMTHVAATTHTRKYTNTVGNFTGGDSDLADIEGLGFTSGYGPAAIVYAGDFASAETDTPELCGVGSIGDFNSPWEPGTFNGEIVVCDRGTFGRVEKGANALAAGAGGFVLVDNGAGLVGDGHELPGVHITQADGEVLKAWLASGSDHMAEIFGAVESVDDANADILAGFSSRGPNPEIDMIIPSIAAPGVDIIAADGIGGETSWGFNSGTSMASPHVAGAAALMMSLYPSWTPAEIQSAMQLTAAHTVLKEDGVTPATPYDTGSGRIDLNAAANAGLVMNETADNYLAANPAEGGDLGALNLASMANSSCVLTCSWTRTVTATKAASWNASTVSMADGLVLSVEPAAFSLAAGESQELTVTAEVSGLPSDVEAFGWLVLESGGGTAGADTHMASMPIAVKATTGDLPDTVHIRTRRDAGSWQIDDLTALAISDLTVDVNGLVKGTQDHATAPQDSDNGSVFDDVTDGTYLKLVDVPAGATDLITEVLASESPDLDMFVGQDLNDDGVPTENELVCVSASGTALEGCSIAEPAAGQWWILVQNWAASAPDANDAFVLSTAVLTGADAGNMTVDGPDSVGQLEPFSLRIFFDEEMEAGDRLYGSFSLGTDGGNAGNLGDINVIIDRYEDDVHKTASTDMAMRGETVTYEITVLPNVMNEDLTYEITDEIPDGMTYVEGSVTGGATVTDGVVSWNGVMPSPFLAEGAYEMTTNATDAACDTPFGGGYVNLEDFGLLADAGIAGDTVAFTGFSSGDPIAFYGDNYTGMTLTDDGFTVFDASSNYGGSPWVNQAIPDPALPNNLAALYWQDFEIVYDAALNHGVTLATAGAPGGIVVVEYDDIQPFGGGTPVMDMEILATRAVDNTPGAWEILIAYDNVGTLPGGTVGVENADGSAAVSVDPSMVANGAMVCFNWVGPDLEPVVFTYDVTVDEDAAFGMTTNHVVSETSNPGSEAVSTHAVVEVADAPGAVLGRQLRKIRRMANNPAADLSADDVAALDAARVHLAKAMRAGKWVNGTTLDADRGAGVFNQTRAAVVDLSAMSKGTSTTKKVRATVRKLVKVSEHLAQLAYESAVDGGASAENLSLAQARLDRAERLQTNRRWQMAVKVNKRAWLAAVDHLKA